MYELFLMDLYLVLAANYMYC